MRRAVGWIWKVLLLLACGGYQFLVHSTVNNGHAGPTRLVLLLLPLLALAYWIVARSRNKPLWLVILAAAGTGTYLLEQQDRLGLVAVYGISHAAVYLVLLWFFGRTLLRGGEALITRLARRVHGPLPPELEAYTRRLTFAWSIFFAAQVLASILLFRFAALDTWSLFINLLNLPLLALMFVGEYVYRVTRHRDYPRASISQAIRVFVKDAALSRSAAAR